MLESLIEKRLKKRVEGMGGIALKVDAMSWAGAPDRLVLLPGGQVIFVELKAPGKKPRPIQIKRHEQLRAIGFEVIIIDSLEEIDERFTSKRTNGI
jgi:hypothetical protein